MNLLIVTSYWPSDANPISGIFIRQQAQALRATGLNVKIIAPWQALRGDMRRPYHQLVDEIDVYSPSFPALPTRHFASGLENTLNMLSCWEASKSTLSKLATEFSPDIIHVHGIRYFGLLIPQLKTMFHAGIVWTIHGEDPYLVARAADSAVTRRLREAERAADRVTVVGRSLRDYLSRMGMSAHAQVVHNGTDLPGIEPELSKQIRERYRDKVLLVSISNLNPLKGIQLNIVALSKLKDHGFHYIVIGDGPERVDLERLASQLAIRDRVSFTGRLSHAETMAYLSSADFFSLPSSLEAFGIVYIEAMARGKPVIGCLETGAAEIIRHECDGLLVESSNTEQLIAAMKRLLTDPQLRRTMGQAAVERARCFTWERNVQTYRQLYAQVLEQELHQATS